MSTDRRRMVKINHYDLGTIGRHVVTVARRSDEMTIRLEMDDRFGEIDSKCGIAFEDVTEMRAFIDGLEDAFQDIMKDLERI